MSLWPSGFAMTSCAPAINGQKISSTDTSKRHRGLLEHPVVRSERVGLLHPQQPVADPAVSVERPLRLTGGAGSVDDVGEVGRRRAGGAATASSARRRWHIEAQGWPVNSSRCDPDVALVRDAYGRTRRVGHTAAMRLRGLGRVYWHERAARLEHGQQGHDQVL